MVDWVPVCIINGHITLTRRACCRVRSVCVLYVLRQMWATVARLSLHAFQLL